MFRWMILELYCQSRRFVKRIYNYVQGTSVVVLCELNLPVGFTSSYMTMKVQQHAIVGGQCTQVRSNGNIFRVGLNLNCEIGSICTGFKTV